MDLSVLPKFVTTSPDLRPLSELPAILVAQSDRDVRGREVIAYDGRVLGHVVDLLVDVDRLSADFLVVAIGGGPAAGGRALVPVRAVRQEGTRLVAGIGMKPIELRYRSTSWPAMWATLVTAVILLVAWALGAFS